MTHGRTEPRRLFGARAAAALALAVAVSTQNAAAQKIRDLEFVVKHKELARAEMRRAGVPASVSLAQAILASQGGKSRLAREANNPFAAERRPGQEGSSMTLSRKAHATVYAAYDAPAQAWAAHSDLLLATSRYDALFEIDGANYTSWCVGLQEAGYSLERNYAGKLLKTIKKNRLYLLDAGTFPARPQVTKARADARLKAARTSSGYRPEASRAPDATADSGVANGALYVVARQGDTWADLAYRHSATLRKLLKYNDISNDMEGHIVAGQIIYIRAKKGKAPSDARRHVAKAGESLWSIAQCSGVRLERLRRFNRMACDTDVVPGQAVSLRGKIPRKR